ncbi:MAG: histidine--tRNA ligase [Oscillospiraceae bacterium]|jgi:histidyl-tRNA synthetase|nr:histidine--tRNA ligase [Oscillospiraceae bacterium]
MANTVSAPRGTKDVLPEEVYKWHYIEATARAVARDFGFRELRFPTFEHTELFVRGVGDTTDVVQKEMYTFEDKAGRSVSLRPEGTGSVVRSGLEHSLFNGTLPVKVYYIAPNFRYENPEAGRLREHHQFGVECFGSALPSADAEVIALASEYMRRLGVTKVELNLNSIGCPECRAAYLEKLREYFQSREEELCSTCRERLVRNPLRVFDCKSGQCREVTNDAPKITEHLCGDCAEHFDKLRGYLDDFGIAYTVNPKLVRGLDYYTRTVFEFVSTDIGSQGTIIGGGRYDGLTEALGGAAVPALGFGSGIERMLMVIEKQGGVIPGAEPPDLYIALADKAAETLAAKLANELRRFGIAVERDLTGRSLKAQFKHADKLGATYSIVIGGDELASGTAQLKNMRVKSDPQTVKLDADEIYKLIRGYSFHDIRTL